MIIDSHCHLDFDFSPKTPADLVHEAAAAGVTPLITIASDIASLEKVRLISERFPNVFHTIGIHPHDAATLDLAVLGRLRSLAAHPKCRAIGEIGLDYHYDLSPRDTQKYALDQQLDLALELNLPVVIHSREAEDDLLAALKGYSGRLKRGAIPGVLHCFSGSIAFGEACLALGFYVSFSGIVTFKNALGVHEAAKRFPLERLLIETDSPFLAPVPFRGKKCEPSMIKITATKLAELRGISFEELARATTNNARAVFRIQEPI